MTSQTRYYSSVNFCVQIFVKVRSQALLLTLCRRVSGLEVYIGVVMDESDLTPTIVYKVD